VGDSDHGHSNLKNLREVIVVLKYERVGLSTLGLKGRILVKGR